MAGVKEESSENGGKMDTSEQGQFEEEEQFRKLFIGGLSLTTTEDSLKEYMSKFGDVVDVVVMKDGQTKRSRGFGFITFSTMKSVDEAMAARPHTIDGKKVDPKRAVPRDKSTNPESNLSVVKLYVSGVKEDHTDDAFREYFAKYGKVTEVDIITDKNTGKRRGFAFVTFDDFDPVDKCCLYKSHHINEHRCDVKKALSREEMQKMEQIRRDRETRGDRSRGGWGGGGGGRGFGDGPWAGGYGGGGYGGYGGGGYDGYNQSYQGYQGGYGGAGGGWGGQGGGWAQPAGWGAGGGGGQWGQGAGSWGGGGYGGGGGYRGRGRGGY